MRTPAFILMSLFLLLDSCADEGGFGYRGLIKDKTTLEPIDSVRCRLYVNGDLMDEQWSDSTGKFNIGWGGYVYKKDKSKGTFHKKNYKPLTYYTQKYDYNYGDTILLEKDE